MNLKKLHELFEWPAMIMFIVGVVTAGFNVTLSGFTPVIWFLISLWSLLMIICFEATQIREYLEKEK